MKAVFTRFFSMLKANTPPSEKGYSSRKFLSLFLILFLAVGNVWAAEFVKVDLALAKNSDPSPSIGEIIGTNYSKGSFDGSGYKIGSDNNSIGWNIASSGKTFTSVSFEGYINTTNTTKNWGFKFSTDGGTTWGAELTQANDGTKSYHSINVTVAIPEGANAIQIIRKAGTSTYVKSITLTLAPDAGGEPVCPETLTITSKDSKTAFLEGDAIELTAALSEGNGAITYQWYKGGTAEGNKLAGKTAAKLEIASCVEGDAGDYYCVASKSDCSDAVNADAFTITVAHNPCATYFWFFNDADQTANGKTNATSVFSNMASGNSNMNGSITIDEVTYNVTRRSGDADPLGRFTVPANKAATFYTLAVSSGDGARKIVLANTATSATYEADVEGGNGSYKRVQIDNIAPGTYTIGKSGGNTRLGMVALKVCDATFCTITLEYADGTTPDGSLSVLDGTAATRPADPTWEHHRFDGWYNGATLYDWTANVTGDLTLTAHWTQLYTITYAAGDGTATGDAPTQVDKAEGETFEVAANTFAVAGKDFDIWFDGSADYAPGATYTVGTANVVLTAQWKALADKYTVKFMDGETQLGTKLFEVSTNPSDADIDKTKALNTFAAWQKEGVDIALDDAFWATLAKDATVTLTARWTKTYATSYDMEEYAVSDGASVATLLENLTAAGYAYTNVNGIDYGHTHNYIYDGMKYKTNDGDLSFNVNAGKLVIVKTGNLPANALTMYINGEEDPTVFVGANEAEETHVNNYFYSAVEALYRLDIQASKGTCVLKAVTITDPFTVSFNANGGDDIAAVQAKPSITLPTPTNGTLNFAGWYVGENKIGDAGDTYLPTENIELVAHWEALSTINTLSDLQVDGVTINGFSSDVHTYNIVVPYGTDVANLPKITSATATNANASVAIWPAAPAWTDDFGGCYRQQVVVTPQDPNAAVGYNDIRITIAPKDGVSIIKVATTGGTNKTVTGLYAGDGDVNLSSNMKMDNGKYIGFTLAGTTLQAGDRINVHTTTESTTGDSHIIFYDNMTDKKELYETGEIGVVGDNIFTINAAMVGNASAYVYRANTDNAHKWNGYIDFIEVLRPMNPVLTAITFDGNAAEMGVGNTFSVTLQNGTDLNAMTVVPTIVKNGEGGSATPLVAWAWGENTYRVTDKDGDYTDYTITLTEAASPSAAPVITTQPADGNYIEGETITALKVVATGSGELSYQWYLGAEAIDGATAATYTPTVDAIGLYVYHCVVTNTEAGHPATSLVSSDATITIAEDPAAIKLLNNAGAINTTDFITGVSATTVNFNDAVHNCATFGSTASTVVGASGLNKYIIYNSKTTQTKIKFVLYNVQNASVTMKLQKLVEGGTEMEEVVINVPSKEVFTTDFYTFDGSANRTMYAFVQNTGIKVLQVKVIDNGTPLKQFGEVGYSINFNKGRLFLASGNEIAYDGLTYNASSNYAPLNNEGLSLASSKSYRFEVPADVTMTVTAANNKKYYITDKEDGSDNETAAAEARSFDLTAGAWYLRVDGSNLGLTKIEFTAPKCEVPVFNALANSDICSGESYVPLNGTAIVSDGGIVTYKWYAEGGTEVLAETATYTPTADGSYYVVATNSLAGYTDNVVQSEVVIVTTHSSAAITTAPENVRMDAGETATLAVVATGKNVTYQWYTCKVDGSDATEIDGATAASYEVTVGTGVQYYKVVVSSDCGTPVEAVVKVEEWTELPLADVTESITWDFSKAVTAETTLPSGDAEIVLANVAGVALNGEFESNKLKVAGTRLRTTYIQAKKLMFHATIPGKVTIEFSNTGNKEYDRILYVNGVETTAKSKNPNHVTYSIVVPAGDVVIQAWEKAAQPEDETWNLLNIFSLSFTTADYTRPGLTVGSLGTICLPSNVPAGHAFGATFYELVGKEPQYGKIVFDEILSGELEAGKPYLFQAQSDVLYCFYGTENETTPDNSGAMKGTFVNLTLTDLTNIYYFAQKALWSCVDLSSLSVPANRAYVKMDEMPAISESNPAPGVRRITLGVNGQQVATGVDQVQGDEVPTKMIINGQLFILRGEKMYDAQGKLVK